MIKHFEDNLRIMHTGSDSFVYHIRTNNFCEDLLNKPGLLECMDTTILPNNYPCYTSSRKKIPGWFSDETDRRKIRMFIILTAKA